MSLVAECERAKDWSSVMKKANILTSEPVRFFTHAHIKEGRQMSLFRPAIADCLSGSDALGLLVADI